MESDLHLLRATERDLLADLQMERSKERIEIKNDEIGRDAISRENGIQDERYTERDRKHQVTLDKLMVTNCNICFFYTLFRALNHLNHF